MANKDTVKQWFETGDYPTEAQFYQKFDWLRWIDEKITIADLDPILLAIINGYGRVIQLPHGIFQYTAPAGTLIEKFWFGEWPGFYDSGSRIYTVRIGTTPGGNEIVDDVDFDVADPNSGIIGQDKYCLANTTIYFTCTPPIGVTNNAFIKIYKS